MELIERGGFFDLLQTKFDQIAEGEGHSVFISGEAGMGKTSLVRAFCKRHKSDSTIYLGTCDALFTPRPLAPLHDIALQTGSDLWGSGGDIADRAGLFTRFFQEFGRQDRPVLVVFEDIHWADEATLDFIKFLARRIAGLPCLFILTFRDDEIGPQHPLRNVLGQLPPDGFTRLQLTPLSLQAVTRLAGEKGYNADNVYSISGGNPFYVNEILATYSPGVPDNIKDSILSVFNRRDEETRRVWEILSVLPTGFEIGYLGKMEPASATALENSLASKILVLREGLIFFKHELYRRTIESSLSPLLRVALNKRILDLFLADFEQNQEMERIIHHAKNANEYDLVVHYAPLAARQAASVGAHIEASKLYYAAIEYYQGKDKDLLIGLYEAYAYECYLTSKIKEAIIYQGKLLKLLKERDDIGKTGDCLRFMSRLWWFDGNRKHADEYGEQAIELLSDQPSSRAKAMAFSNMSQLKMLSDLADDCLLWGHKAIAIAKELGDEEILCHALNNVGTVHVRVPVSTAEGLQELEQSLAIALKNGYHEHAARAYTNMGCKLTRTRDFVAAVKTFDEGIQYSDERDLGSWSTYMLSWKARSQLEAGDWDEAYAISEKLVKKEGLGAIVIISALAVLASIRMRRGTPDVLSLLNQAKEKAFETMELQRVSPVMTAILEYEWITGKTHAKQEDIDLVIAMMQQMYNDFESDKFVFWLLKARRQRIASPDLFDGYRQDDLKMVQRAAALWERVGCPYEQALALFEGDESDKKKAVVIVKGLGANAVYDKMTAEMKTAGMKSIPRGIRKTTQSNPAQLTEREVGVLQLLQKGLQNKEIAARLFISAKTVDHHISAILFKLDVNSRAKAVQEALQLGILK